MTPRALKTFGILQVLVILGAMAALLDIRAYLSPRKTLPPPRSLQAGVTGAPVRFAALLPAPLSELFVQPSVTVGGDASIDGASPALASLSGRADSEEEGSVSGEDPAVGGGGGPGNGSQGGGPGNGGQGGRGHGSGSPPGGPPGSQGGGSGGGNDGGHGNNGGDPPGGSAIAGVSSSDNGPPAHAHVGTRGNAGPLARCRRHDCVRVDRIGSLHRGRLGP